MDIQRCIILAREKRVALEELFLKEGTAEGVEQIRSSFNEFEESLSMDEEMTVPDCKRTMCFQLLGSNGIPD